MKYEFKVKSFSFYGEDDLETQLNHDGDHGWNAVSIDIDWKTSPDSYRYARVIFSRPLKEIPTVCDRNGTVINIEDFLYDSEHRKTEYQILDIDHNVVTIGKKNNPWNSNKITILNDKFSDTHWTVR